MTTIESELRKHLRFNFIVNLFDGGFFGMALGFSSFTTILPLFVSQLTDSAILIGLIPAIHEVGWQAPQLLTAGWVARLRRYKATVLWLSIHERLPFFGLAIVAWLLPGLGNRAALILTFILLIWQGFGGGFTANPWTSMISKIIPSDRLGTFFGLQAAAANVLSSLSALLAGLMIDRIVTPLNFSTCFLLAGFSMIASWFFLSLTREPEDKGKVVPDKRIPFWRNTRSILRGDSSFRAFLLVRIMSQFAVMGFAFYIVHASKTFNMDGTTAGIMTSVLLASQIIANPLMGWLGDRWSHRRVMMLGLTAATLSSLIAGLAASLVWFYLVFILSGLACVAIWTIAMTMTVEFGTETHRPVYIGLANSFIAPATFLAPIFGGLLADVLDFRTTFLVSSIGGVLTVILLHFLVKEPVQQGMP